MTFIPFSNPIGLKAAYNQLTNGFGPHGPEIWDTVAAVGCHGNRFKAKQVVDSLKRDELRHLARRTVQQYVNAFFAYCLAAPEDFSGPASKLVRTSRGYYKLVDGDEQ